MSGEGNKGQREYNLCPGCGKTSTLFQGGYIHGGISWHEGCLGKKPIGTKEGFAAALRECAGDKACELEVLAAYDRLEELPDA